MYTYKDRQIHIKAEGKKKKKKTRQNIGLLQCRPNKRLKTELLKDEKMSNSLEKRKCTFH